MEVDADGNAVILRLPFAAAFMTGSVGMGNWKRRNQKAEIRES
jgi:hypothetical protein